MHQRKKDRLRKTSKVEDEEAVLGQDADANYDDLDLPKEPIAPSPFDEDKVRQEVIDKFLRIRRKPGEPKITPILTKTAAVTALSQCPSEEKDRRSAARSVKYVLKVLYNGKEVSQTAARSLSDTFTVEFAQSFDVVIVQWPESVVVQVRFLLKLFELPNSMSFISDLFCRCWNKEASQIQS